MPLFCWGCTLIGVNLDKIASTVTMMLTVKWAKAPDCRSRAWFKGFHKCQEACPNSLWMKRIDIKLYPDKIRKTRKGVQRSVVGNMLIANRLYFIEKGFLTNYFQKDSIKCHPHFVPNTIHDWKAGKTMKNEIRNIKCYTKVTICRSDFHKKDCRIDFWQR